MGDGKNFEVLPTWKNLGNLWDSCSLRERVSLLARVYPSLTFPFEKKWDEMTFTERFTLHDKLFGVGRDLA